MTDIYLDAQDALTAAQRTEFLRNADAMFPRLRGAHVADVLSILDDADWACGEREASYDAGSFDALDPAGVRVALIAAEILGCEPHRMVGQLVGRAGA